MLKLTSSERQAILGPVVVGCALGAFVGVASWGFDREYSHIDSWRMAFNAAIAFLAAFAVATVPLGVLPIAVHRFRSRSGQSVDDDGQ